MVARFCVTIPVWIWPTVGSVSAFAVLYALFRRWNRDSTSFYLDPQDFAHYEKERLGERELPLAAMREESTFAPLLENYIGVAKLLITVAAASIAFGGNQNSRTGVYLAKIVLAFSILYGVAFAALLQYFYDEYSQNVRAYTPWRYSLIEALGFSALGCFVSGFLLWAFNLG